MKRPSLSLRLCLTLGMLLLSPSTALAAPRVGLHPDYTRLAFDLPKNATYRVDTQPGKVSVTLDVTLASEHGKVSSPNVSAYGVSGTHDGSLVTLSLTANQSAKVFVLAADGKSPARLVVDIGPNGTSTGEAARLTRAAVSSAVQQKQAQATSRPAASGVVTPVSTRAPARPTLRVVLDAGHGGRDPGMVGFVTEKETTLSLALKVRERLQHRGIDVVMTRDDDSHLSPDKSTDLGLRAKMANAGTVNAFVSIHVNAASPSAQGIETWVFGRPLDSANRALAVRENGGGNLGEQLTKEASNVAQNLLGDLLTQSNVTYSRKLANLVQNKLIAATGAVNRGVGSNIFYVIRNARTPAILIEVGFGSHPVEGRKLATEAYRDRLAAAVADALIEFLHAD
ncbi:N-acetylmuramoyl-L-alanine amidase family protein [Deinococcus peraridilitoris]|uniref:N-acetylmuramoyl-L-alanine amidase family protein n=1 Tax=Deinococcus peraridilitoris TaxID=432329 RepID=UPI001FE0175F|nr:N-acetylmuramoyl-L-alanine amidase [Deinococcus peraridilitoris]